MEKPKAQGRPFDILLKQAGRSGVKFNIRGGPWVAQQFRLSVPRANHCHDLFFGANHTEIAGTIILQGVATLIVLAQQAARWPSRQTALSPDRDNIWNCGRPLPQQSTPPTNFRRSPSTTRPNSYRPGCSGKSIRQRLKPGRNLPSEVSLGNRSNSDPQQTIAVGKESTTPKES